jgi:hypothetical protein
MAAVGQNKSSAIISDLPTHPAAPLDGFDACKIESALGQLSLLRNALQTRGDSRVPRLATGPEWHYEDSGQVWGLMPQYRRCLACLILSTQ